MLIGYFSISRSESWHFCLIVLLVHSLPLDIFKVYCLSCAEPMLTEGSIRDVMWNDNWTCVTEDGGLSAQFEHSLLITESGVEILTL